MKEQDQTKRFWDDVAKKSSLSDTESVGMLTDGDEINAAFRKAEEEAHLLRFFKPSLSMNVLEVGSGGGRWSFFFADKVTSVVGIDISEAMIEIAEARRRDRNISNVRFETADLINYQTSALFDLVYFSGVLQYLQDRAVRKSIQRALSLLSPNGVIISRDTVQEKKRVTLSGEYPVTYRTINEYKTLFSAEGLEMSYHAPSYKKRRFSRFASRLSKLPLMSVGRATSIQKLLLAINKKLGEPRILMQKHYRDMLSDAGERTHCFFLYQKTISNDSSGTEQLPRQQTQ